MEVINNPVCFLGGCVSSNHSLDYAGEDQLLGPPTMNHTLRLSSEEPFSKVFYHSDQKNHNIAIIKRVAVIMAC